jgi:hypothetical protein
MWIWVQLPAVAIYIPLKALQPLVELATKKSGTSAEKLLCMVKSYEYRYRDQDIGSNKPGQIQRRIEALEHTSQHVACRAKL